MHVLPQLRELEQRFGNRLAIVGVHSAKYTAEGGDEHLRHAVLRLGIDHPVVNDSEMLVWQNYAVRAWPTLMFIDPHGKVIGKHEGEFDPEAMADAVEAMLAEFAADGALVEQPLDVWVPMEQPQSTIAYPAALAVTGERLYVSDTCNNRILELSADGAAQRQFGSGEPGFSDGEAKAASFHAPHGLTLDGHTLFVADTGSHALRAIDLTSGDTATIAGTGDIAQSYSSGGPALETALRSPWDLTVADGVLYIAMAGNHQLWMHELGSGEVRRYAGTGHEGKRDDTVPRAWLAQPVAIDMAHGRLLFCDAETSSVRVSDTRNVPDGQVETLVGKDLFDWGDIDGDLAGALLQHASGIAVDPESGSIYIADTYNNKIKRLDLRRQNIETIAGTGEAGHADGPGQSAEFFEPHGLAILDAQLFVADTNNHAIRRIDLSDATVTTLDVTMG